MKILRTIRNKTYAKDYKNQSENVRNFLDIVNCRGRGVWNKRIDKMGVKDQ